MTNKRGNGKSTIKTEKKDSTKPARKRLKSDSTPSSQEIKSEDPLKGVTEEKVNSQVTPQHDESELVDEKTKTPKVRNLTVNELVYDATPTEVRAAESIKEEVEPVDYPLPEQFVLLERILQALVTVYQVFKRRGQGCTWSSMKEPMKAISNSEIELHHITQIQTILPDAVKLEIWKHRVGEANQPIAIEITAPSIDTLKETFHDNLHNRAKQQHTAFLSQKKLKPPAKGWHPRFDINSIPAIPASALPVNASPQNTQRVEVSAQANLSKTDDIASNASTAQHSANVPRALVGISLDTIMAARELEEAGEEEDPQLVLLRRLPDLARTLHSLRVEDKRFAFSKKKLLDQVVERSAASLSHEEADPALVKLQEVVPQWISSYRTESGEEWVRFSRDVSMATCLAAIQKAIAQ